MIIVIAAIIGVIAMSAQSSDWFYRFDHQFRWASRKHGVPWRWIKAVAMVESNLGRAKSVAHGILNPTDVEGSKSSDGKSWGIMQTTIPTSIDMVGSVATPEWLNKPENSIDVGAAYLKWLMQRMGNDRERIMRAYNGGPGYMVTALGPSMTAVYYGKITSALLEIQKRQPGNEMEIG